MRGLRSLRVVLCAAVLCWASVSHAAAITVYLQSSTNWDTSNAWNTLAGGGGTAYTNPQNGANTFTCDLNGNKATIDTSVTVTQIQSSGAGYLTSSGTYTVTATFVFSGSATSCITVTAGTLTLSGNCTHSGASVLLTTSSTGSFVWSSGAISSTSTTSSGVFTTGGTGSGTFNGTLTQNGPTYGFQHGSTGTLTVSNPGNTLLTLTSGTSGIIQSSSSAGPVYWNGNASQAAGEVIHWYAYSPLIVVGNITSTGGTGAILITYCPATFIGTIVYTGTSTTYVGLQAAGSNFFVVGSVYTNLATATKLLTTAAGAGTITWEGNATIPAGYYTPIAVTSGCTFNFGVKSLALSVAGTLTVANSGTVNQPASTVTLQSGGTINNTGCAISYVNAPVYPTAVNVLYGSGAYGPTGANYTPSLTLPNNGNSPYTPSSALVLPTGYYGPVGSLTQGTASAGGARPVFGGHTSRR
jgi:hypothetical protein